MLSLALSLIYALQGRETPRTVLITKQFAEHQLSKMIILKSKIQFKKVEAKDEDEE